MNADVLARLEELERKATPRPWIHDVDTREDGADHLLAFGGELTVAFMPTPQEEHEHDAMLLVALRNAAPALLWVARAARLVARWSDGGRGICAHCGLPLDVDNCVFADLRAALAALEEVLDDRP